MSSPSTTLGGSTPRREGTVKRVKSLFRKDNNGGGLRPMSENQFISAGVAPPITPPMPLVPTQANLQKKNFKNGAVPVTPPLQREPSYENINIFADGDTASSLRGNHGNGGGLMPPPRMNENGSRGSGQTTFSDMMERSGLAGLQKGQREF